MRYWFDTEFIEDGRTIELLSIGMIAEDGRALYYQSALANHGRAGDWVKENVLPHLDPCPVGRDRTWHLTAYSGPPEKRADRCDGGGLTCPWMTRNDIAAMVRDFCDPERHGKPEFWGYYADYDWVALCQLFGTMTDLPKGWPMYCRDIKQWCDDLGNPRLPEQGKGEHHALADARWNRSAWEFLAAVATDARGRPLEGER